MKKFLSLFAAIFFAGTLMAGEKQHVVVPVDMSKGVFTAKVDDKPAYITWSAAGGNITIKQTQGKAKSAVGENIATARIYVGQILEFEAADGYTIDTIFLRGGVGGKTYSGKDPMIVGTTINAEDTTVVANTTDFETMFYYVNKAMDTVVNKSGVSKFYWQNGNGRSGDGQLRTDSIAIAYTKEATSTPEITAGDVNFGLYVPGISGAQKLTVVGENLSEAISATMEGSNFEVTGTLTATGGELTISVKATADGEYSNKLTLKSGSTTKEVNVSATILNTSGKGTKDDPFTTADVIKIDSRLGDSKYWVVGYIVGTAGNNGTIAEAAAASSMALGATAAQTDKVVPVELPNNNARKDLNVLDNPTNVGKQVKVSGTLEKYKYFTGVKGVSEYEWIDAPAEKSKDASIKLLKINGAAIAADNKVYAYVVPAAEDLAQVEVVYELNHAGAKADKESGFKVNVPAASTDPATEVKLTVTAEDETTTAEYTIKVSRAAADAPKSDDATLKEVKINNEIVAEKEGVFAYEVAANVNLAQVEVSFVCNEAHATADKENPFKVNVPASAEAGPSEVILKITAENKTTTKEYKISITRAAGGDPAGDQSVDQVSNGRSNVRKMLQNGILVIEIDGVRYNIHGQKIQ